MSVEPDHPSQGGYPRSRRERFTPLAIILILCADGFWRRTTLVDPLPLWLTLMSALAAPILFWPLVKGMEKAPNYPRGLRGDLTAVLLLGAAALLGPYVSRAMFTTAPFVGATSSAASVEAHVLSKVRTRRWNNTYARADFGNGTRTIDVPIDDELYRNLEPYRAPGRDCIMLRIETGRGGIRRALVPNHVTDHPLGMDSWRRCSAAP